MVKVQKPLPKSLSKQHEGKGVTKKKQNVDKVKAALATESKPPVASSLLKKKIVSANNPVEVSKKAPTKSVKTTLPAKQAVEKKAKAIKRPLILAPPESPSATPPIKKNEVQKSAKQAKATTKPQVLAPPESPVVLSTKKNQKATKPAKVNKEDKPLKQVETADKSAASKPAKNQTKAVAVKSQNVVKNGSAKKAKELKEVKPLKQVETANKFVASKPAKNQTKAVAVKSQNVVKNESAKKAKELKEVKPLKQVKTANKSVVSKPAKNQTNAVAVKSQKVVKKAKELTKTKKPIVGKKIYKGRFNKNKKGSKVSKGSKKIEKKNKEELQYDLKLLDIEQFNEIVCKSKVQAIVEALKTQAAAEVQKQKSTSIFSDFRYLLQVCSFKIASCPKRMVKLNLNHSLVGENDDVALIVTDLQRGARFEYEPTKQHYEDLLRELGVEQRLKVVPFNQLRQEMGTYEAKRKFVNSYDYLLCDGRISGHATAFLGQCTQKPRNVLHAVHLTKPENIKAEITRALNRTAYRQLEKGDLTSIPIGNHEHSSAQLAENILLVTEQLKRVYPGGLANVRSLFIKIDIAGTSALPLYISMCSPPETPYVVGPKEQRMLKMKQEANAVLGNFTLTKDAEFVKLNSTQRKRRIELQQKRAELLAAEKDDEEDNAVPSKKARSDPATQVKGTTANESNKNVEQSKQKEDDEEEDTDSNADNVELDSSDQEGDDDDEGEEVDEDED
ncbi:ribosomal L1 domain-containing protein CG13096 [Scaptodrosophila lebanonensis]|uniref:Ribosomal L1 domain-containing protein CG13096 n=1 Tax=Drosophila lebanonensis TaxID=7225 RepID=A0A6J2TVA0_DROLE|nr:ribosomal L1 domain-containing protein CG13096 [Scaptodrosophila lebanonensis]